MEKLSDFYARLMEDASVSAVDLAWESHVSRSLAFKLKWEVLEGAGEVDFHRRRRRGPPTKDTRDYEQAIRHVLNADCTLRLVGISKRVRRFGLPQRSPDTVRRILRKMGWTRNELACGTRVGTTVLPGRPDASVVNGSVPCQQWRPLSWTSPLDV